MVLESVKWLPFRGLMDRRLALHVGDTLGGMRGGLPLVC